VACAHLTALLPACKLAALSFSHRANVTAENPKISADSPTIDFERSLSELEAIVEKLEQGDLTLDESLKQFERGVQLARTCQSALKEAEQKVEILLRKSGDPEKFDVGQLEADDETDED
jgi:exodeoxyribonuclease VII small subunit